MQASPLYASIGALIIDDIKYQDGTKVTNVLGGGGVFAIYGMRLWLDGLQTKDAGYIIHTGFDYPEEIDNKIKALNISLNCINHPDKHTTRGLNTFGEDDHRDFEYIHPIIRTTTSDFSDDWIQSVKILHLISSHERAIEIIDEWKEREILLNCVERTQFLWEPLPWACLPENLDKIYDATQRTEIITPNHEEIAAMLGLDFKVVLVENGNDLKKTVEYLGNMFLDGLSSAQDKVLVIRASKYGTMIITLKSRAIHWVPAYWSWWSSEEQKHVVDVTGAGNAFCGGYAYGWDQTQGDPVESAYYGAVSASYAVEQMGMPSYETGHWNNGPDPAQRLSILRTKSCKF
ncbi:Ribokinase-like protein [Mucor mucedo]|uniref:Ribokinase-like protein n=1 Tax=Mucor mucedo TaxID=29922 RepID=UPI0022205077|nr:Ribokinase-like protein [Mucor mucedo]KAI7890021.1 Ribokinase-like protein [Mucor mucedo]